MSRPNSNRLPTRMQSEEALENSIDRIRANAAERFRDEANGRVVVEYFYAKGKIVRFRLSPEELFEACPQEGA